MHCSSCSSGSVSRCSASFNSRVIVLTLPQDALQREISNILDSAKFLPIMHAIMKRISTYWCGASQDDESMCTCGSCRPFKMSTEGSKWSYHERMISSLFLLRAAGIEQHRHSDCNCLQILCCLTDQCALQILVHHECALQMLVQDVDAGRCALVPTRSNSDKDIQCLCA